MQGTMRKKGERLVKSSDVSRREQFLETRAMLRDETAETRAMLGNKSGSLRRERYLEIREILGDEIDA